MEPKGMMFVVDLIKISQITDTTFKSTGKSAFRGLSFFELVDVNAI